ncbi:MAG: hypothetical protein IT376_23450, partial [Polyangiaceae bacterium]|nr:hypothetical protein [Polyangiaceae bacterium]
MTSKTIWVKALVASGAALALGFAACAGEDPAGRAPEAPDAAGPAIGSAGWTDTTGIAATITKRNERLGTLFRYRAPVPLRAQGGALAADADAAGVPMHIDVTLGARASDELLVGALGAERYAVRLAPVHAAQVEAELSDDGRAVYRRAFGSADLVRTLEADRLHETFVIHGADAPDVFVWQLTLGEELAGGEPGARTLRHVALDDDRSAFVDEDGHVRLFFQQVTVVGADGAERTGMVELTEDGHALVRVDHEGLVYPALVDVEVQAPPVGVLAAPPVQIKGRVMVALDTSGSMIWRFQDNTNVQGDGDATSVFCDNELGASPTYRCSDNVACTVANGARPFFPYSGANPSRMFAAKSALRNVINAHNGVLDFGLMRFPNDTGVCSSGTNNYCCTTQTNGTTRGRCSSVGTNTYPNWNTGADVTFEGSCGTDSGGGRILVSPGASSGTQILPWIDFKENFCSSTASTGGAPRDPEVRGGGSTPLARQVRYARLQWYEPVYNAANGSALYDAQLNCRPYVLVVMTDGVDTCNLDPSDEITTLRNVNATNRVTVYTLGMGNTGALDVTELNQMAVAGGTGPTAPIAQNQSEIEAAFADIVASTVKTEVCNGADDNCNALIDEGLNVYQDCQQNSECGSGTCNQGRCTCTADAQCNLAGGFACAAGSGTRFCKPACSVGVGACQRNGVRKCSGGNSACCTNDGSAACTALSAGAQGTEVCNGLDDNCNGIIDDVPGGCSTTCFPEICNGVDDDCDGTADDNPAGVGVACGSSVGICDPGVTACVGGALVCQGGTPAGPTELCNGLDDDCNGSVDGMSRTCYAGPGGTAGVGLCRSGTQACTAVLDSGVEAWGTCVGQVLPATEVCNGLDDDCDGAVDDVANVGTQCCPSGNCANAPCAYGTWQCSGGTLQCIGHVGPGPEVCNGVDDDCDGTVDDVAGVGGSCCPSGSCGTGVCVAGTLA